MKKLLYVFSALALIFTSCSSDSDSTSDDSSVSVLPKRYVETTSEGSTTTYLNYNGNKLTGGTSSDGLTHIITYTGNLITSWKYVNDNGGEIDQEDLYTYNTSGDLIEFRRLNPTVDEGYRETFTYNGDGTVSVNYYDGTYASQTNLNHTGKIFLTNGDITKIEEYFTSYTSTRVYTYDNKNTGEKNIVGYSKLNMADFTRDSGIFHNVTLESYSRSDLSTVTTNTLTYTYNSDNYPVTSVETDGTEELTTQYFYE